MASENVDKLGGSHKILANEGNKPTMNNASYKVEIYSIGDNNNDTNTNSNNNTKTRTKEYSFYQKNPTPSDTLNIGNVLSISHKQKMYEPSSLEIKLQITEKDFKGELIGKLVWLYDYENLIAKDYFIFNEKRSSEYLTLKAYSADYFLTIDKFCQAFTAKTLVEGIISPSLETCSSPYFDMFRTIVKFDKNTSETQSNGNDNEENTNVVNYISQNVLNFLNGTQETIIPYAVQYNESFYDFMVRMCNRDGEFLYLDEQNNLCIGLKSTVTTTKTIENTFTDGVKEYINSYGVVDSSSWINKNYLGNSFTSDGKTVEEKGDEDGYIHDFNLNKSDNLNLLRQYYILAPEYLENVSQKDEYAKWGDYTCGYTQAISKLHAFGDERNVMDALTSFGLSWVYEEGVYKKYKNSTNEDYDAIYKSNGVLYSTDKITRTNENYKEIYKNQEKSEIGQLSIHCTKRPNIQLGEVIGDYVVYSFNKTIGEDESHKEEYEVSLIKKVVNNFYPLPMPEKRIRKSSAQRAIVVDNFDPSRLGRVRVRYPWQSGEVSDDDRKNFSNVNAKNASPWIRISNPMASNGAGFLFIPDINDEVLIDYEDGNIERPYVCGAFYNNTNRPSIASQSQTHGKVKSITSANGHHISFTDVGGTSRLLTSITPLTKTLGAFGVIGDSAPTDSDAKYWGGGFEIADYYGVYSITGSTHNRSISINSPFGDVSINAFTGITINAPLGDVKIVGKNVSIEARNNLTLESGTNINGYLNFIGKDKYKSFGDNPLMNWLYSEISSEIVDLGLIRNIFEMLVRPIGGTMLLKSNRYMRLEAGEGKTVIDDTNDYDASLKDKAAGFFLMKPYPSAEKVDIYAVKTRMVRFMNDYKVLKDMILSTQAIVKDWNNNEVGSPIINGMIQNHEVVNNLDLSNVENILLKQNLLKIWRNTKWIRQTVTTYQFDEYKTKVRLQDLFNTLWNLFEDLMCRNSNISFIDINKKDLMYKEFEEVVKDNKNNDVSFEGSVNENNINTLNLNNHIKKKSDVKSSFKQVLGTISGFEGFVDDKCWSTKDKGAILFSDNENNYFKISNEGSFIKADTTDEAKQIIDIINSIGNDPL